MISRASAYVSVFAIVLASTAVTPSFGFAQVAGAVLTGVIVDQAGAAVPGATVTVSNLATNQPRSAVTTDNGVYSVAALAPGDYGSRLSCQASRPFVVTASTSRPVKPPVSISRSPPATFERRSR